MVPIWCPTRSGGLGADAEPPGALRPGHPLGSGMADENGKPSTGTEPAAEPAAESSGLSERLMGLFGLAVAIGLALIAIDLIWPGSVSKVIPARETDDDG